MTDNCPRCASPLAIASRYCESCGADLEDDSEPDPRQAAGWEAVVRSDRDYFDRVEAGGVEFPSTDIERTFTLIGERLTLGRRSTGHPEPLDLDLSGPPADIGVSHLHASFVRQADDAWAVVDCQSTNGTYLNDRDTPIPSGETFVLEDGDRIHIGAWTTITVRRVKARPGGD
jgi:hypothetical protein